MFLLDSWPGSWEFYYEPIELEVTEIEAPPVDKMVRKPAKSKARK